jgi:uncharacterized protein YrzB (UPF0473 family)
MSEEEDEFEVLTMPDENGVERDFALLTRVELEEGTFAILAPVEQVQGGDDDDMGLDLYAFSYTETEDSVELDAVEDDELLDRIFKIADEILFGEVDEDDDDDDDGEDGEEEEAAN